MNHYVDIITGKKQNKTVFSILFHIYFVFKPPVKDEEIALFWNSVGYSTSEEGMS
jgi:hypothetical protein